MLYYATLSRDFGDFKEGQKVKVVANMHYGDVRIKSLDDVHSAIIDEEYLCI